MRTRRVPEVIRLRQRREIIAECLAADMGIDAIARRLGLSVSHTTKVVRDVTGRGSRRNGTLWTDDEKDQLRAMWGRLDSREIGKKLGRGRSSVLGCAYRLGLMKKGDACRIPTLDEEARQKPTLPRLKCLEKVWE